MVKLDVCRPSNLVLVFLLLPGKQLSDGGPIKLEYQDKNGAAASAFVKLAPRFFRLLYVIAMAWAEDEAAQIEERFRGYRSTEALRELYAKSGGDIALVEPDVIISYVREIRLAIKQVVKRSLGVSHDIDPVQHTRGLGYRVGDISIRIKDYH